MQLCFDRNQDFRIPPKLLLGIEILKQAKGIDVTFGKSIERDAKGKQACGNNSELSPQQ